VWIFSQKRGGSDQCYFNDFCAVAEVTNMPNFTLIVKTVDQ
jgi:hypothetical protein